MRLNGKLGLFFFTSLSSAAVLITQATPVNAATPARAGTSVGQLEGLIDLIGIDVTQPLHHGLAGGQ